MEKRMKYSVFLSPFNVFSSEIQMTCEPQIVRHLIELLKYRSWTAIPANISRSNFFKLQKEADFYQIKLEDGEIPVHKPLEVPEKHQSLFCFSILNLLRVLFLEFSSPSKMQVGQCHICRETAPVSSVIMHVGCGRGYAELKFDSLNEARCFCNSTVYFTPDKFIQIFRCLKCIK